MDIRGNKTFYDESINTLCPLCKKEEEDELHVKLQCPSYEYLRTKYSNKHWKPDKKADLNDILNTNDTDKINDVAIFIYYSMKKREYMLNN